MHRTDSQMTGARQVWLRDLFLIESSYGKLVYLAGLLDPNTGRYEHYGSKSAHSDADVNRVLRRCHADLFKEWSGYSLERKMADVRFYIAGLGTLDRIQLIDAWLRLTPYKNLVPAAIQGPERQKNVSDFEAILGLLRNVYGVASPDPTA
jgi:hypothetical protein